MTDTLINLDADGEIIIAPQPDGSVRITQANFGRPYDDEVTIAAADFPAVFQALKQILNERRERESI